MSRIGATISGLERMLLDKLAEANAAAAVSSLRLATNKKVNAPADDPAAYLAIARLESERNVVAAVLRNVDAAATLAAGVELALAQARTRLNDIRTELLSDADQSLTAEQRQTAQAQIDAALAGLNDIAGGQIAGRRLLDGSANFRATGVDSAQVRHLQVFSAGGTSISGSVDSAATPATLTYTGAAGQATADAEFTLTGKRGAATIAVTQNEALTDVRDRINLASHETGITASVAGDVLTFTTVDYGESATIAVEVETGTFNVAGGNGDGTAEGTDAEVTINGRSLAADGNRATFNANGFHFVIEFAAGFSGNFSAIAVSDASVSKFALSTDLARRSTLALPGIFSAQLGGISGRLSDLASGGALSGLAGNTSQAIRVVDEALWQLAIIEGRVAGFATATIASSSAFLEGVDTNLADALESLDGIDVAEETALLSKNRALASNALAALAILRDQQADVVAIVRKIAGLG